MIEGSWQRDRGVAVLSFETFKEAQRWKDSVPGIRQQDWLDGVDLIIVTVEEMPRKKRSLYILQWNPYTYMIIMCYLHGIYYLYLHRYFFSLF